MDHQNNFSVLVEFDKYQFVFGGYTWSISVAIDENRLMDFILDVVDWIQGHNITTNFKFSFVNQRVDTLVKSIAIDGQVRFTEDTHRGSCVFSWRTSLNPLELTFNDNLIIVAEFFVKESPHHHNQLDDGTSNTIIVQLAEEACHKHPSVIECHKNKNHSSMFTKWGFIALGRVLHFLKTKKVKDMNDEGCKELQVLWKEVIAFGFDDLAWLEPHVKCALGMRNHKERTMHVKKMKENVAALEVDLKVAREELIKAEEGFEERDLNDVLGY
ncbi:hypothetical protein HN51_023420 [Arachis hypogaea]|uniref:MATH domain-containing protein n=1 Tax=Arachis hypogaea TaxID=3818 RepID=A0A445E5M8_ARAHY|nr:uncharacterized protein LOC112729711 [Arachis hypogaea]QHO26248.1 uncharacterized protein DS421_12g387890 [Arachis hypogaea]RYR70615.1 hypothetical protein Ahy_A02g004949 [Arachis hypogaea]